MTLDSAEKGASSLRDIGMDGYFCRIYGWGCSGGVLIMTATPTLPRGAYRLRPVFGLSSFVGLQFYGYFDAYAVGGGSTVTIVDKLLYYFSHL